VSIIWGVAFALRLALELVLFSQGKIYALGTVRFIMGWPFTVLILVASYLYGQKRLQALTGPGVEEFKAGARPPWEGQRKGF
jgi:choline-glycine betaine transporter